MNQNSLEQHGIDSKHATSVFWMVELMEAWLLADPDALASYYGSKFSLRAIGQTEDIEKIPKAEVLDRLKRATRKTAKREYNKVTHAPKLLEMLNPDLVKGRAENCRRLFEAIVRRMSEAK